MSGDSEYRDLVASLRLANERMRRLREDAEGADFEDFADVRREILESITHLRHLTDELHPRMLDAEGLEAALRFLIERTISTPDAPACELEYRLAREPPTRLGALMHRLVQEALTAVRTLDGVSRIVVSVEDREGGWLVGVRGSAPHVDAVTASSLDRIGLLSTRERAEAAGGWCRIESMPGSGIDVQCWLPGPDSLSADASLDASSLVRASKPPGEARFGDLSPRELEVAELLALGHTNAEVAAILYLSVRTIEHHRSRVFQKLGVQSRAGLVRALRER